MAKVVAVANQKGGVAKTTTVQAVGVALAERGWRTLVVDLDPQACLTYSFGIDPDGLERSMHDVLLRRAGVADVSRPAARVNGLTLAPATIDLAGAEVHLLGRTAREHELARALDPVLSEHDIVLIDCPPSLGVLTINGLTAAEAVIVPLQCEALSHRGVDQLLETVDDVRTYANEKLAVLGVVATMYDGRTRHAREVLEEMRSRHGLEVLGTPIPKSIRFAESPALGMSILEHAPHSAGADAYRQLADEILRRLSFEPMPADDLTDPSTHERLVVRTTSASTMSAASGVTG
jgi:chromosome partitioning protein